MVRRNRLAKVVITIKDQQEGISFLPQEDGSVCGKDYLMKSTNLAVVVYLGIFFDPSGFGLLKECNPLLFAKILSKNRRKKAKG